MQDDMHEIDAEWERAQAIHDAVVQATFALAIYRDGLPDEDAKEAFDVLVKEAL